MSSDGRNDSMTTPHRESLNPQVIPESDYDKEFFHRVVADAGRWAYGVVFVEVWVMNENRTQLERPEGGFWVDPVASRDDRKSNSRFRRLIDPTLDDYFPPVPLAPGICIPGALWAQANRGNGIEPLSPSIRNGTIFGRGQRRNRSLFPNGSLPAGMVFQSYGDCVNELADDSKDQTQLHHTEQQTSETLLQVDEGERDTPSRNSNNQTRRQRRSSCMDDVAARATREDSSKQWRLASQSGSKRHKSDIAMGGRWKHSWLRSMRSGSGRKALGGSLLQRHNLLPNDVRWRQISEMANDPDQPFNTRILYLENECEIGFVAGVPFQIGPTDGIVIYMARKDADVEKLVGPTNEKYLTHSSLLIGSAYALRKPRLAAEKERHLELYQTMQRVQAKIHDLSEMNQIIHKHSEALTGAKDNDVDNEGEESMFYVKESECCPGIQKSRSFIGRKVRQSFIKFFGSQTAPPPAFTWEQTGVTFVGTCVTMSVLLVIDTSLVERYGEDYGLIWGPFGALLTLLFSLTSAPASQPRNVIFGQTVSLFIAYGFGQTSIDSRIKACLATSIAIATMARLGITHPPAGACAMIFSSGMYSLRRIGFTLLGNVVAILVGALCNNISDRRQYPTSWQIGSYVGWIKDCLSVAEKLDTTEELMNASSSKVNREKSAQHSLVHTSSKKEGYQTNAVIMSSKESSDKV